MVGAGGSHHCNNQRCHWQYGKYHHQVVFGDLYCTCNVLTQSHYRVCECYCKYNGYRRFFAFPIAIYVVHNCARDARRNCVGALGDELCGWRCAYSIEYDEPSSESESSPSGCGTEKQSAQAQHHCPKIKLGNPIRYLVMYAGNGYAAEPHACDYLDPKARGVFDAYCVHLVADTKKYEQRDAYKHIYRRYGKHRVVEFLADLVFCNVDSECPAVILAGRSPCRCPTPPQI